MGPRVDGPFAALGRATEGQHPGAVGHCCTNATVCCVRSQAVIRRHFASRNSAVQYFGLRPGCGGDAGFCSTISSAGSQVGPHFITRVAILHHSAT